MENGFKDYVQSIVHGTAQTVVEKISRDSRILAKEPLCQFTEEKIQKMMVSEIQNALKESFNWHTNDKVQL